MDTYADSFEEMYDILSKRVYEGLKSKINASIYVTTKDGDMLVKITKGRMEWHGSISNVFVSLVNGYSSENIVNYIVKQYKKAVFGEYFY